MSRKKVIVGLNILLICTMIVHVGVKIYLHGQSPEYSAPAYVELINAVYYLIPLFIINVVNLILNKR